MYFDYFFQKLLFASSQVCLIYVERLMETAHVPLLAGNWKPVLLCGLLLASKVIIIDSIAPRDWCYQIESLTDNTYQHA